MIARAPSGHRCGQSHHRAKLSDAEVKSIRDARSSLGLSYAELGKLFGAPLWTIRDICTYRTRINA